MTGLARAGALVGVAGVVAALGPFAMRAYARRSLPPRNAMFVTDRVRAQLEIRRDRWGVPHLYAADASDLFFGVGLVHAQDRFWQMELQRRAALGTLSEIFGERTLEVDRLVRRLGIARVAAEELRTLPSETRQALDRYAEGVNHHLERHARRLPVEFAITRHTPEPWRPLDSLAWAKMMSWSLAFAWDSEIVRARLIGGAGPVAAAGLEPFLSAGDVTTVPPGKVVGGHIGEVDPTIVAAFRRAAEHFPGWLGGASNGWTVRGERSASGAALLANDLHLAQRVPSIWYEAHLSTAGLTAYGATLPGLFGVVVGHNGRIAWGVTAALTDTQDLFGELIDPTDPLRYAVGDEWQPCQVYEERIAVRGRPAVVERVRVTRHGPILVDERNEAPALALSDPLLRPGESVTAGLRLMRATDWTEFRHALSGWTGPALNYHYADRDGNIGFQLAGSHPDRPAANGLLPQAGWLADAEWRGYRAFDSLPSCFNPTDGMLASANNRVTVDPDLGHDYHGPHRVARVWQLLRERGPHTVASFRRIQTDVLTLAAESVIDFARLVEPRNDIERAALQRLVDWDRRMSPESIGATIYELTLVHLVRQIAYPVLGDEARLFFGDTITPLRAENTFAWRAAALVERALKTPDWWQRYGEEPDETWGGVIARAFRIAITDGRARLGDDIEVWRWGRLHRLTMKHALGDIPIIGRLFNRGPYPIGGDSDTVVQTHVSVTRPGQSPPWIPTYRQIIDLGDLDNSVAMFAPGQSGQVGSPHYDDLVRPFLDGEYHPMLFSRGLVERETVGIILVRPSR